MGRAELPLSSAAVGSSEHSLQSSGREEHQVLPVLQQEVSEPGPRWAKGASTGLGVRGGGWRGSPQASPLGLVVQELGGCFLFQWLLAEEC